MGRRVNAARQAADDRQAGSCEPGRQTFRLPQAVTSGVPRAHDGQCQLIAGPPVAPPKENSGRIGDLVQQAGITRIGFCQDVDLMLSTEADLAIHIDFRSAPDALTETTSDPGHAEEVFGGSGEYRGNVAEVFQQLATCSRADACNEAESQRVAQQRIVWGRRGGSGQSHGHSLSQARGLQVSRHDAARRAAVSGREPHPGGRASAGSH